jgi:hypothetical protein
LRTSFGVGRQAIKAPIRLPSVNEIRAASASSPIVHGNACATISETVAGNWVSE